jgi:hypothetical protein
LFCKFYYQKKKKKNFNNLFIQSYTKPKHDEQHIPPNEVYLSADDTCRDLLTRESAIALNILPGK